ncbi:MAG: hypothetical protein NTU44_10640 [Bacteroidetes bacterium]|nr:hypothetical protein [Bacteroidota bacterium]
MLQELKEAKKINDGSLNDKDLARIRNYYALAVPAILGEACCLLRGKKMSVKERLSSTYQGALSALSDDFFDEKEVAESHFAELVMNPEKAIAANAAETLLLSFIKKVLENSPDPELMRQQAVKVFKAQAQSMKQTSEDIQRSEIEEITWLKGGNSFLLYRYAFSPSPAKPEEEMWYRLGGLMQLGNDIFDIYRDSVAGIRTLMTTATKVDEVRSIYLIRWKEIVDLAGKTDYNTRNIKAFLRYISLINSRVHVCLEMLVKLEKKSKMNFNPKKYTRKELICDMGTPGNLMKAMICHFNARPC